MDPLPPLPTPLPENRFRGGDEEVGGPLAVKRFGVDELEVEAFPSVGASAAELMDPLPPLPTPLPENRFRGGDEEVGGPLAVKRFGVDELEVEAFPSVGASAAEPPVSEELVQRLDPPVSGVMDSPLVLLFAFFSWKWRKKLVQLMAVFGREGGLAKEMAGLLVDAQESGNAATATDNVNMMFCSHSSAYFTRSRSAQNQHVPMSAALDAPASWLVRRPSLLRCCSWAAWLAA